MNKFFYKDDNATLIKGSCFTVLKKIKERSISFIFADPPYFLSDNGITCRSGKMVIVNKGSWDKTKDVYEKIKFSRKWIRECYRILKDDGSIMISGTFHIIHIIGTVLEQEGFEIINNITWVKTNPPPNLSCKCFVHSSETIIWAKKALAKKCKFNYKLMKQTNQNKQMKDVWTFGRPKKIEIKHGKHPTQKPLALLQRIILATTDNGDVVLDPFVGSGTTAIAAIRNGCSFIGIDTKQEYLEIAKQRIIEEVSSYEKEF